MKHSTKKFAILKDELNQLLHVEGKTIEEAAIYFGCSKRTIQKRMQEYGLQFRPRQYDLNVDQLIEMYESGMTLHEIAADVGVHYRTVYDRIRDRVQMRDDKMRDGMFVGPNHWHWAGGVDQTDTGYIRVRVNGEHKAQHRWIMEDLIGRPLRRDEHVHHVDGKPWNNVPSNLLLVTQREHMKLHAAMRRDPNLDQRAFIAQLRRSVAA